MKVSRLRFRTMRTTDLVAASRGAQAALLSVRAVLVLLAALASASCGSSNPSGPSADSPQRTVSGSVQDAAFRPLAGAQVAIVGTRLSTVTGADGRFELTGGIPSPLTVRAAREGYVTETRAFDWPPCTTLPGSAQCVVSTHLGTVFRLESLGQAVDISGDYTVTLSADNACADFPSEARSRTYNATIVPNSPVRTRYSITVQAPSLLVQPYFEAGVTGDFLALRSRLDPNLVDQIAPNTYVTAGGGASATVVPGTSLIAATLDGLIEYCRLKDSAAFPAEGCAGTALADPTASQPVNFASCQSRNHRLTFTRR
jgi:hypothetical protein